MKQSEIRQLRVLEELREAVNLIPFEISFLLEDSSTLIQLEQSLEKLFQSWKQTILGPSSKSTQD